MRVVATTGMPGSGKSLAIEVAEELGLDVVQMGDLVREETSKRGLPKEPESFGKVASELREEEGPGAWAHPTADRVAKSDAQAVLVDGIRNLNEVEILRDRLDGDVLLLAFLASPETRYERMIERGRAEDAEDEAALRQRDLRELGYGLGDVIAMADIYIDNEGSPAETKSTLRAVLAAGV